MTCSIRYVWHCPELSLIYATAHDTVCYWYCLLLLKTLPWYSHYTARMLLHSLDTAITQVMMLFYGAVYDYR